MDLRRGTAPRKMQLREGAGGGGGEWHKTAEVYWNDPVRTMLRFLLISLMQL